MNPNVTDAALRSSDASIRSTSRVARDLLAHVPLIALSVGPDLKVGPGGTSRLADELLGGGRPTSFAEVTDAEATDAEATEVSRSLGEGWPLAGRGFVDLMLPENPESGDVGGLAAERAVLEDWLRLVFEKPDQDWETVAELCPLTEIAIPAGTSGSGRAFRLGYHPMRAGEGGPIVRLLVVGTDFSAEQALADELHSRDAEGEASVRRFADVLKLGAETFRRFINESRTRLAECAGAADRLQSHPCDREAARTLFRQIHTLKANARAFRLDWLAAAAEPIEEALAELRDADSPGEHPTLGLALEQIESLNVLYDEAEDLAATVFGRALDPGETRARIRDLEVPVRVGRLESALALARGAASTLERGEEGIESAQAFLAKIERSLDSLRRVPARGLFQRFPWMVADLAAVAGRRARPLKVTGSDVLVNVRALDQVGDALVHLLRNAVVHGIEPSDERVRANKPEAGSIELSLGRESKGAGSEAHLVFEVADDGRGIDREAVRSAAVQSAAPGVAQDSGVARGEQQNTLSAEQVAALAPEEVDRLVLVSGLSTAPAGSGRGVGFDGVVAAAEFLDGKIEIESRPGQGMRVRLTVPDRGPC